MTSPDWGSDDNSESEAGISSTVDHPRSITVYGSTPIPLDSQGKLHCTDVGIYLQYVAANWASTNSSLCRIYVRFGFDEDLNIVTSLSGFVGFCYRIMKTSEGWKYISYADWSPKPRAFGSGHFKSFDGLPGILDDDRDFFGDDYADDIPW